MLQLMGRGRANLHFDSQLTPVLAAEGFGSGVLLLQLQAAMPDATTYKERSYLA